MPRKRRPPDSWADDLFSALPESFVEFGLSLQSWPAQEKFPVNHVRAHMRDVVAEDLHASDTPMLIAGYSSIAALVDLVADWRRRRGDRPGSVRLLLGSEPFPSRRAHFASAQEEFTEEVRGYWLERSISVRLSAKVIRVIEELDAGTLRVRVIPGPPHLHAKVYVGDSAATVGSSNYTDYGLARQLEANARFERSAEPERYDELVMVAENYWSRASLWDRFRLTASRCVRLPHFRAAPLSGDAGSVWRNRGQVGPWSGSGYCRTSRSIEVELWQPGSPMSSPSRSGQVREQGVEGQFLLDAYVAARHGIRQARVPRGRDGFPGEPGQPRRGMRGRCRCRGGLVSVPVVPPRLPVGLS